MGNLLVGQDGLRGVLDWELAHTGDPAASPAAASPAAAPPNKLVKAPSVLAGV
ncbi:MAG: phosphotransferase [Mycobacterium sp.]